MAQPMRECPVCEAIVLLQQDHCSICGHDLSLPAPEPTEEEPTPEVPPPSVVQDADEAPTRRAPAPTREGASLFVGVIGFVGAALFLFWFVSQGGPLDDTDDDQPVATAAGDAAETQLDLALAVCAGGRAGVAGAPPYTPSAGVHPTAVVIGDLASREVTTTTELFPQEWLIDVSERPLDSSELVLCLSRVSSGEVDSVCASTTDPDALQRLEATYRLRVYVTATGERLVDEPLGSEVFGPCPDPGSVDSGTVYASPNAGDLVTLAVPLILIG